MRITYGREILVSTAQYENTKLKFELEEKLPAEATVPDQEAAIVKLTNRVNTELGRQLLNIKGVDIRQSRQRSVAHAHSILKKHGIDPLLFTDSDIPF